MSPHLTVALPWCPGVGGPVPLQCIRSGVTQAIVLPHACLVSEISGVENLKKDKSDKACGTSYRLLKLCK